MAILFHEMNPDKGMIAFQLADAITIGPCVADNQSQCVQESVTTSIVQEDGGTGPNVTISISDGTYASFGSPQNRRKGKA